MPAVSGTWQQVATRCTKQPHPKDSFMTLSLPANSSQLPASWWNAHHSHSCIAEAAALPRYRPASLEKQRSLTAFTGSYSPVALQHQCRMQLQHRIFAASAVKQVPGFCNRIRGYVSVPRLMPKPTWQRHHLATWPHLWLNSTPCVYCVLCHVLLVCRKDEAERTTPCAAQLDDARLCRYQYFQYF